MYSGHVHVGEEVVVLYELNIDLLCTEIRGTGPRFISLQTNEGSEYSDNRSRNPLKTKLSPYRKENTILRHYKDQLVNAV
jgi:hypothetical protein